MILTGRQSVDLTLIDHAAELGATHLDNLAVALRNIFERQGEPCDIKKAIPLHEKAVAPVRDNQPEKPLHTINLRALLTSCFNQLGNTTDINRAL